MCFSSKMKVPKADQNIKAPEPQLLEPPKGLEVGDGPDDSTDADATPTKGKDLVTIKKTGDGTSTSTPTDTGSIKAPQSKPKGNPSVRRALTK